MTHVDISGDEADGFSVKLDGLEISSSLMGMSINLGTAKANPKFGDFLDAEVTLYVKPGSVEINLEKYTIEARTEEA